MDGVGSGTINFNALTLMGSGVSNQEYIVPSASTLYAGVIPGRSTTYSGISSPANLGSGNHLTFSTIGTGDLIGVNSFQLFLPQKYVSGNALSDTVTFAGSTFSSLGITPGTYTYSWGSGANADSMIINIVVPEPSTWAMLELCGFALFCFALHRRRIFP